MSLMNRFKTNKDAEVDGIWNQFDEEFRVKIARTSVNNITYTKAMEKAIKPFRRTMDLISNEMSTSILRDVYSRTIVLGWQTKVAGTWEDGIDMDGTGLVEVSPTNIRLVFDEMPDLFSAIQAIADDAAMFRQSNLEKEAKN